MKIQHNVYTRNANKLAPDALFAIISAMPGLRFTKQYNKTRLNNEPTQFAFCVQPQLCAQVYSTIRIPDNISNGNFFSAFFSVPVLTEQT